MIAPRAKRRWAAGSVREDCLPIEEKINRFLRGKEEDFV
jgi:hypothetical protein